MGSKGRRLKRYLGLKRETHSGHHGGIEHLLPGKISGWVVGADAPFHEVRLLVGAHLIARAEINQNRPDVCAQLGHEGTPGFSMELPGELPPLDWTQPPRLLALSADGRRQADLQHMGKGEDTAQQLRQLLQSEALGLEGHCDGVVEGQLQGWAARRRQIKPAQIWLQADNQHPIPIDCNQWRAGMSSVGMPDHCGFQLSLSSLPAAWSGHSIWCSFDHDGLFRLPQEQAVEVPTLHRQEQLMPTTGSYSEHGQNAPTDLQSHWQALEDFRLFLDGLEQELNRRDGIRAQQSKRQPSLAGFVGKLLRQGR
jgi:hypothetical protein